MTPMIRLEGVAKRFDRGTQPVLRDVCLEVVAGEAVHVRGANGAGKTTLLRLLAGVIRPSAGVVDRRTRAVGWAPADPIGGRALTAQTLLAAAERLHGGAPGTADDLIERLGLRGHTERRLGTLSAGNRHKVNLAFALASPDPGLLVLDEPWATLDGPAGAALTSVLEDRCRAGSAVVFTDHTRAALHPEGAVPVEIRNGALWPVEVEVPGLRVSIVRRAERDVVDVPPAHLAQTVARLLDEGWSIVGVERV